MSEIRPAIEPTRDRRRMPMPDEPRTVPVLVGAVLMLGLWAIGWWV
jgi:hypothetical protein